MDGDDGDDGDGDDEGEELENGVVAMMSGLKLSVGLSKVENSVSVVEVSEREEEVDGGVGFPAADAQIRRMSISKVRLASVVMAIGL